MADKEPTRPDPEDVPDVVLEELLAAFSKQDGEAIDFDDPSIDRLLGLGDSVDRRLTPNPSKPNPSTPRLATIPTRQRRRRSPTR